MKFRNTKNWKLEIALGIVVILILSSVGIWGVTRTITDTSDTIDTYIRNSNGKYWEATGANIQLAINDLNFSMGGTVWLPNGAFEVAEPIKTYNRTISIIGVNIMGGFSSFDGDGAKGTLLYTEYSGFPEGNYTIECGVGSSITHGVEIKNLYLDGRSRTQPGGGVQFKNIQHGRIENIYVDDYYADNAVGFNISGDGFTSAYNTLENFRTRRTNIGVLLSRVSNINIIKNGLISNTRTNVYTSGLRITDSDTNVIIGVNFEDIDSVNSLGSVQIYDTYRTGTNYNKFIGCRFESNYFDINISSGAGTGNNIFIETSSVSSTIENIENGNQPSTFIACPGFEGFAEFGNYVSDYVSINNTGAMNFSGLAKITLPVAAANTPSDGTMYWNTANDTLAIYDSDSSDWRYFTYD